MPTIDSSPSTVATNALSSIPYAALIGGPLDACIKAQATSALTTVDFIKKVGFRKVNGEDEVVNVTFQYMKDGQRINLIVPLLAIVPIPYIGIDSITIDFKAKIAAEASSVLEESSGQSFAGEASGGASLGIGPFSIKVNFKANYSSKKDSKATQNSKYSVEYTMDIHVGASQADMPAGLAKVLNILESNISQLPAGGKLSLRPLFTTATTGKLPVEALVQGGDGAPRAHVTVEAKGDDKVKVAPAETDENGIARMEMEVQAAGSYSVTFTADAGKAGAASATMQLNVIPALPPAK